MNFAHYSLTTSILASLVFLGGCSATSPGAKVADKAGANSAVIATYNGKSITAEQIDNKLKNELYELDWKRYQLRASAINQMVIEDLLETKAAAAGQSPEELLKAYLAKNTTAPTVEQATQLFESQIKSQDPEAKFEDFRERILAHLSSEANNNAMQNLFEDLQKEAKLEIHLDKPMPSRVALDTSGASKGPSDAPITIVEFADFQCGYCSKVSPTLESLMQSYPGKIRVVFKHFPLSFHKEAPKASEASLCASEQSKFWEYHDLVFANQAKMDIPQLKEYAASLKLDVDKFNSCLDSGKHQTTVAKDLAEGEKAGVRGTPSVYINGLLQRSLDLSELRETVEAELKAL